MTLLTKIFIAEQAAFGRDVQAEFDYYTRKSKRQSCSWDTPPYEAGEGSATQTGCLSALDMRCCVRTAIKPGPHSNFPFESRQLFKCCLEHEQGTLESIGSLAVSIYSALRSVWSLFWHFMSLSGTRVASVSGGSALWFPKVPHLEFSQVIIQKCQGRDFWFPYVSLQLQNSCSIDSKQLCTDTWCINLDSRDLWAALLLEQCNRCLQEWQHLS